MHTQDLDYSSHHGEGLKRDALPFNEVLAQSVANIAPTATPAINLALVFGMSGNGSWLTYVVATIGLLLIGLCINQFAKRSATPGSIYSYVGQSLGPNAGFMVGWGLLLAYLATGMAVVSGCVLYASDLFKMAGIVVPSVLLVAIVVGLVWFVSFKDVQLSARAMLLLEVASVGAILLLGFFILKSKGFAVDQSQLQLQGMTADGLRTGLVLAIFSFVGFESATAMGAEAKNPLKTVPRAVIMSTLLSGIFFVIMSYIMVVGFHGAKVGLDKAEGPLNALAIGAKVPWLGVMASIGGVISFFACALACATAASRIMMAMSRDGYLPSNIGKTHVTNSTPHIAAGVCGVAMFLVPATLALSNFKLFDIYGLNGTIATYGFLVAYISIAIGAMVMLSRRSMLTIGPALAAIAGIAFMLVAVYGSIVPFPAAPYNALPPIFAVYMIVGAVWMMATKSKAAQTSQTVRASLSNVEAEGAM